MCPLATGAQKTLAWIGFKKGCALFTSDSFLTKKVPQAAAIVPVSEQSNAQVLFMPQYNITVAFSLQGLMLPELLCAKLSVFLQHFLSIVATCSLSDFFPFVSTGRDFSSDSFGPIQVAFPTPRHKSLMCLLFLASLKETFKLSCTLTTKEAF